MASVAPRDIHQDLTGGGGGGTRTLGKTSPVEDAKQAQSKRGRSDNSRRITEHEDVSRSRPEQRAEAGADVGTVGLIVQDRGAWH